VHAATQQDSPAFRCDNGTIPGTIAFFYRRFFATFHAVIEKAAAGAAGHGRAGGRQRSKILAIDCVTRYDIRARQPPLPI